MSKSLVLNISAHDRPGIMSCLSNTITTSGGNWLESRMARLAGQFVGVVCIQCEPSVEANITTSLEKLNGDLTIEMEAL